MERGTIIVVVAIILTAVLIFSFYQITGQIIKYTGDRGACSDTDNGIDTYVKGRVTYANRNYQYTDHCVKRAKLKEYFCSPGNITIESKRIHCEKGCLDGVCVR